MRISDWSSDVCSSDLPGTKSFPTSTRYNKEKEAADAKRMFELRTGPEKWTIARIADEMECSTFRVQKLLNKYTPKLLEGDASRHREIEIGKLDLLEEKDRKSTRLNYSH